VTPAWGGGGDGATAAPESGGPPDADGTTLGEPTGPSADAPDPGTDRPTG